MVQAFIKSMCLITVSASVCVAPVSLRAEDEPQNAISFHVFGAEYGFCMNMDLAKDALSRHDVEWWARLLEASDAQRAFMLREYDRFAARNNAFVRQEGPSYIDVGKRLLEIRMELGAHRHGSTSSRAACSTARVSACAGN